LALQPDRNPVRPRCVREHLGYLNGGFHRIIDALEKSIGESGGMIRKREPLTSILRNGDTWVVNNTAFDAVISTIPPQELQKAGGPVMPPVPYQGAACVTVALDRDVSKGIYWLNMKDSAPYGAVVSHTNFIPVNRYGDHLVYLASYFTAKVPAHIDKVMIDDFCTRFSITPAEIRWHRLAVDPFAGPVYTTGYKSLIIPYRQQGLFMAGMFSPANYPERSMEGSVRAGKEVAACISRGDPVISPEITAIIPLFNDRPSLEIALKSSLETLSGITSEFEILVAEDGSTDGSTEFVRQYETRDSRVRLLHHDERQGRAGH